MTQPERESMEVDILFVGAGPATLASAYHLMKQVEAHNEACSRTGEAPIDPPSILVIEKAAGVVATALIAPESGEAHCGAQFK